MKRKIYIIVIVLAVIATAGIWIYKGTMKENLPINVNRILKDIKYLSSDSEFQSLQYRIAGTQGEQKAADYIEKAFENNGLYAERQSFSFDEIVKENSNLVQFTCQGGIRIEPTTSEVISGENIDTTVEGKLINLGNGTKKDFTAKEDQLKDKFILIEINESTSVDDFTSLEYIRGVKGIIVYDPTFTPPDEKVIANKFTVSGSNAIGGRFMTITTITKGDYEKLTGALSRKQEIDISEYVKYDTERKVNHSQNIIATKISSGSSSNTPLIIVGAHYDCANNPGADDNASGVASLVELSRVLSNKEINYDVKLVVFGAEEVGLFGSNYFVSQLTQEDRKRCKLMINLDGTGLGDTFVIGKSTIEKSESIHERELAFQIAKENKISFKKLSFPDSDHFYFSLAGIPTITFASMESLNSGSIFMIHSIDPDYHTFADLKRENINISKGNHTFDDTYDSIEASNKINENFKKLFTVLLGVLENADP